jgi:hypothetical protein
MRCLNRNVKAGMESEMALFEDVLEGGTGPGLLIGIGALVLGPTVLPAVGRALRPMAKAAIKTGIRIYEEGVATVSEATGDIVAEARSELASEGRERGRTAGQHQQHAAAPAKG